MEERGEGGRVRGEGGGEKAGREGDGYIIIHYVIKVVAIEEREGVLTWKQPTISSPNAASNPNTYNRPFKHVYTELKS